MIRHSKIIGRHALFVTVEVLAVVAVLLACAGGMVASRLRTGPMDVSFARGYIESALQNKERGTYATISSAKLEWPDLQGPLILDVQEMKFFNRGGRVIMSMEDATLKLSRGALLIGRIAPVGLVLDKPEVRLVRRESGGLSIGFGARRPSSPDEKATPTEEQKAFTARILQYVARPGHVADKNEPLATLETFEIHEAHIRVEDRKTGTSFQLPSADFIFKAREEGLTASFYESFRPVGMQASFVKADLLIPWDAKNVYFKTVIQNFDANRLAGGKVDDSIQGPRQSAFISAELVAIFDGDLNPQHMRLLAKSQSGHFMLPGYYSQALPYRDLSIKALYNGAQKKLKVTDSQATVRGVILKMNAELTRKDDVISGPVMASINELAQEKIKPLWPDLLKKEKARRWITEKISGVTYKNLYGAVKLSLEKGEEGWDTNISDVHAGFDFENMNVDYRPSMIPVSNGRGKGVFDLQKDTLRVEVASAKIGGLQSGKSIFEIGNLVKEGPGTVALDLNINGPLAAGLDYLSKEPIELKNDFDRARMQGDIDVNVKLNLPTTEDLPVEDVKVEGTGKISNALIPGVMNRFDVTGGPFAITVKDNEFTLKGSGKIEGEDITLDYREFLHSEGKPYTSRITAQLQAGAALQNKLGMDLTDFVQGALPVDMNYTQYANDTSQADLKINLTPVQLIIAPFNYRKEADIKANASLTAKIEQGILKGVSGFKINAPGFTLDETKLSFSQKTAETKLARAEIGHFKIGDSQGRLDVSTDNATGGYKVTMNADYFNLRPYIEDKKSEPGPHPPLDLSLKVQRAGMSNDIIFGPTSIALERNALGNFNRFEFSSDTGRGLVEIAYKPDGEGRRSFNMTAADAGAALRAFDVYENMRGGALKIEAMPISGPQDRNLAGRAEIRDFTIVHAPTLARLLGALSLPGVLSLLNDEGLSFSKLQADTRWVFREPDSLITFKDGRTSGNAVGFTFDGSFDLATDTIDVEGTIVPLSEVNKIISKIPLVGDILTGGSSSVFAATYTIRGPSENPDVMVNPLAVLAPGILRRILFE
ncbi:MAG: YhdP family protein [Alphaproteobacteria bacterium]